MPQSVALPLFATQAINFLFRLVHGGLLSIGLAVAFLFAGAYLANELPAPLDRFLSTIVSPSNDVAPTPDVADADTVLDANMQAAVGAIAKRYRVAQPAIEEIVRAVENSSKRAGLDPLLVLAVIGVESRFNPYSESSFGAQGLMQIIGKFHGDKFEASQDGFALLDPATNIRVGVKIIHEYLRRTGDLTAALKLYGGESDDSGRGYADKVFAEKIRLEQAIQRVTRRG